MSTQLTEKDRRDLRGRSGGVCEVCAQHRAEQVHHRQPRGMGGTSERRRHALANLIHVCFVCHNKIERNRAAAELNGWLVPYGMDPAREPVYLRLPWPGWFILGDSTVPQSQMHEQPVLIENLN